MTGLIENIQREAISNRWVNNKGAQFEHDNAGNHYRLIELTPDCKTYLVGRTQRNDSNCPVIVKGFIAYLIRNWGKSEKLIFDGYYKNCLNRFKQIESRKPGSSLRNLDNEFYVIHIKQEKENISFSKQINPYLSEPEIELINQYVTAYFIYIEPEKKTTSNNKFNGYSSKEWCTIIYFTDFSERNDVDYNTNIIKSFHAKHKLPFAETSFLQNFKEVKRHIEKSEKQAIKLIEKIIPYFSNKKERQEFIENQLSIIKDDIDRK
jgi:hypothetical protein